MAYRFQTVDEPVSQQIQRIFLEEIDAACCQLKASAVEEYDSAVHGARKNIKKTRALLRLVSRQIDKRLFHGLNRRLRDIGRSVSELRDAQAIIDSFAALPDVTISKTLRSSIQKRLNADRARAYQAHDVSQLFGAGLNDLQAVRLHIASMSFEDGYSTLEPAFLDIYKQGRKALRVALINPSPENLHNFRKRVKDHWYHARLLSESQNAYLAQRQSSLRTLESLLGESHNLHVLQETLLLNGPKYTGRLIKTLKAREDELSSQALTLGGTLYAVPSSELKAAVSELKKLWPRSSKSERAVLSKPPMQELSTAIAIDPVEQAVPQTNRCA